MTADDARRLTDQKLEELRVQLEQHKRKKVDESREKYRAILDYIYHSIRMNASRSRIQVGLHIFQPEYEAGGVVEVLRADGFLVEVWRAVDSPMETGNLTIRWDHKQEIEATTI